MQTVIAFNAASIFTITASAVGGFFCFSKFAKGCYEAALPGICCFMGSFMEMNFVLTGDWSYSLVIARNVMDMGLILCVCVFLHRLYKCEGGRHE